MKVRELPRHDRGVSRDDVTSRFPESHRDPGRVRENGRNGMKQAVVINGIELGLDTEVDPLLYSAPRQVDGESAAYRRGRDLYLHEVTGGPDIYYIHGWSLSPDESESIMVLPNRQAERFLGERGLECSGIPGARAYAALKDYGYGIIEEF